MGNLARLMIGHLLTLLTAATTLGLGAVALQQLLARRVRIAVRAVEPVGTFCSDLELR